MDYLHHVSFGIGVLGVLVIVYGVVSGLIRFLQSEFLAAFGRNVEEHRIRLRHVLGYYLLLGLEFLIAADIMDTLIKPSVQDLVILGAIVLIRTVIGYSLNSELRPEKHKGPALSRRQIASEHNQDELEATDGLDNAFAALDEARTVQRAASTHTTP